MSNQAAAERAAQQLSQWANATYTSLTAAAERVTVSLEDRLGDRDRVERGDLAEVKAISGDFLAGDALAVGAGAILARDVTRDSTGLLDWWVRTGDERLERLVFDLRPDAERYYDYELFPWFADARATQGPVFDGPYLDHLGYDEYVLTLTVPLTLHGRFAGVVGCDIKVRDLEPFLTPILRGIPGDAALLNDQERIVGGNSARYLAGDRVRSRPPRSELTELAVPHVNLHLIHEP